LARGFKFQNEWFKNFQPINQFTENLRLVNVRLKKIWKYFSKYFLNIIQPGIFSDLLLK